MLCCAQAPGSSGSGAQGDAPGWGWGVTGWDGPAAPRTRGSAGGIEQGELVPTMPPQLRHIVVVTSPQRKVGVLKPQAH